ncbi:hypothetical protein [Hymenobacter latericus]|uniref:hypothetical protein n=1 Tax=Hymenobacter sp. YIM 151858-1 TaxID=2987688 RepID=UPI0022276B58|nr:hypothetical protein [Hymenobacter sp. YIM 151858-1]UYZ59981.1 hypothetical protein OIS50_04095 [Hymenobacter sp. YIM 151858-1]
MLPTSASSAQLLFVYNADSGWANALLDAVHKAVSPATYPCSLCGITYGAVSMHPAWKQFLRSLPVPAKFVYRNQLPQHYPQLAPYRLPAVFVETENRQIELLVSAEELGRADLAGLMHLLRERLSTMLQR